MTAQCFAELVRIVCSVPELIQRVAEIVLGPRPLKRQARSSVHLQRRRYAATAFFRSSMLVPNETAHAETDEPTLRNLDQLKRLKRKFRGLPCLTCGKPIDGLAVLDLADGNHVHLDGAHGIDCLLAFGERWRGEATAGLRALGLDPPADFDAL